MPLREFGLIACIRQVHSRLVKFLAGKRTLLKKLLAAVIDFLLRVELLPCSLRIELGLLNLLRQIGGSGGFIRCLCLIVGALVFLRGGGEIAVFQNSQQLSCTNAASAIDQKLLYGSADLRNDGGLRYGEKHRVSGELLFQRCFFNLNKLNRNNASFFFLSTRTSNPCAQGDEQNGEQTAP